MFALYGSISLTNDDIEQLRVPLKTKLATLSVVDSHCTLFRHTFAKLAKVGQGVPKLESFNLFSTSIKHHPILHLPIQQYHASHTSIATQEWETLASHLTPQMPFLID